MPFRAVIFDLGGVVLPSPLDVFRAYEARHGLPHRFLSEVVIQTGEHGAWSRFERGELDPDGFAAAFEVECADAGGVADGECDSRLAQGSSGCRFCGRSRTRR